MGKQTRKEKKKNSFAGTLPEKKRSGKLITRFTASLIPTIKPVVSLTGTGYQKLKAYQKLRAKGIPPQITYSGITQTCKNCRMEFSGNYCYNCGQKAKLKRLNFNSFMESLLGGITNVSNGFLFTIINLFSRPGYMLNDYIRGKRVRYTTPFQLLFVTAAIFAVTSQLMHPKFKEDETQKEFKAALADSLERKNTREKLFVLNNQLKTVDSSIAANAAQKKLTPLQQEKNAKSLQKTKAQIQRQIQILDPSYDADENMVTELASVTNDTWKKWKNEHPILRALLEMIMEWFSSNKAIVEVTIIPFIALAAKWAFRKSKVNPRLNFIEMVFVTSFISCQILIISLLALLCNIETGNYSLWLRVVFSFWVFKELFRNSYWMTFRKTFRVIYLTALNILLATIILGSIIGTIAYFLKSSAA